MPTPPPMSVVSVTRIAREPEPRSLSGRPLDVCPSLSMGNDLVTANPMGRRQPSQILPKAPRSDAEPSLPGQRAHASPLSLKRPTSKRRDKGRPVSTIRVGQVRNRGQDRIVPGPLPKQQDAPGSALIQQVLERGKGCPFPGAGPFPASGNPQPGPATAAPACVYRPGGLCLGQANALNASPSVGTLRRLSLDAVVQLSTFATFSRVA